MKKNKLTGIISTICLVSIFTVSYTHLDVYKRQEVDAAGKAIYPGFIDAHAHFYGYGQSLQSADLRGTKSWDEVISRLNEFAKTHPDGWLTGRGCDQNDWDNKQSVSYTHLDVYKRQRSYRILSCAAC